MRELVQQGDLSSYLRRLAAASMFVVSISTPIFEIASTVKSTYEVANLAKVHQGFFGEGPYWIESRDGDQWRETSWPDPLLARYASVWTIDATMARSGRVIGGYDKLMDHLKGFEVLEKRSPRSRECAGAGTLLVKQPSAPHELEQLRKILHDHAIAFAIDDGSGVIHHGNMFMGNGLYS
ncbi:hypothetical protein [Pseudomonas asiatica]|uniref:Uncharacterized protein n=1 Tax=Pseudomonas asiatica TaxID=2219225 RepID=A0A9X4D372_9PSED|nr:hypothetical protein [Pseudomonas asiatica]MDD2106813.1 hypothetical protein [Pseudomonas asiatica]